MTYASASPPDLDAPRLLDLAAHLRLMACALVAELLEFVGLGRLAASMRRRMAQDVAELERYATGIVVLMALRRLPSPSLCASTCAGGRQRAAPPGFAWVTGDAHALRAMQRALFPRMKGLKARLARLDAVLDDMGAAAARLARRIARLPPAARLIALAPPAMTLAPHRGEAGVARRDSS